MSEPKFTKGPWFKKGRRVFWQKPDRDLPKDNLFNGLVCICATTEDDPPEVMEEAHANAALIATSPELYASEEKNLKFLKLTLSSYREFAKLAKQECQRVEIKDIELIIQQLEQRIAETDQLLKKAIGKK